MSKVKLIYEINKEKKETLGLINKNRLVFNDSGVRFNITFFKDEVFFKRESDDYTLKIRLNNEKSIGECYLDNYKVDLDIKLQRLNINENNITFSYYINDKLITFSLKYEVIK